MRLAITETARPAARLVLLCFLACIPALAQTVPPEPDPLSRIRAQAPAPACSDAEPTLCAEAAPKIIANAMGSDSSIEPNLRQLASGEGGHAMGAPVPAGVVAEVNAIDWAVAAFRDAGLDAHTEIYTLPARPGGSGPVQRAGENVVAEIQGREKPDEIVILGAHFDTTALGRGTLDADCDAGVVIEAARDIHATGLVPRRTIRFVLFTGGEPWGLGSWSYVQAHRGEMDRTVAAIIFDQGSGGVTGYLLGGRHDIEQGVREAIKPFDSLGALADSFDAPLSADNFDFLIQGVPNLLASQDTAAFDSNQHPAPASPGNVDFGELKHNAAIAGVTAFDVAEDVAPLGPRLSRADIETLLMQTGLDERMKRMGIWSLWENGQRGRQP